MQWHEMSVQEWELLAPTTKGSPSPWDRALDEIEAGTIVRIEPAEGQTIRGVRIGIARRAATRGMKLEFRQIGESALAVRKSSQPYQPRTPKTVNPPSAPRGRPRREPAPE